MVSAQNKILVSPLNWGLGHATRCIPIIRMLLEHEYEVVLGTSGSSGVLLQQVFPQLLHLNVPSHTFTYSRTAALFAARVIQQIPQLITQTRKEHQWLMEQQKRHQFKAVISDNRFGMYHKDIPSIFITHQLGLKTGLGTFSDQLVQKIKYQKLKHFDACWVPDIKGDITLAGALSHPKKLPEIPVEYIGWLSGIEKVKVPEEQGHLLILLSGPEPLRTQWEKQLMPDVQSYPHPVSFVRGLPEDMDAPVKEGNKTYYPNVSRSILSQLVSKSTAIICRSGYSSVMDIIHHRKKAILVPTPGQPEQEYLAVHLSENNIAPFISQKTFTLRAAMNLLNRFPYQFPEPAACNMPDFISHLHRLLKETAITT